MSVPFEAVRSIAGMEEEREVGGGRKGPRMLRVSPGRRGVGDQSSWRMRRWGVGEWEGRTRTR